MPKKITPLTDKAVLNAKAKTKPRKLFDGSGLYLLINPDGAKYWRLKYRFAGAEKLLALGVYPEVGLASARDKATDARKLLQRNVDPAAQRKAEKEAETAQHLADLNTFEAVALEWYKRKKAAWAPATARKADEALTLDLIPALGKRPIADLKTSEVVAVLRVIEKRSPHMAHKAQQYCGAIVRYAITTGRREEGKFMDFRDALTPLEENNFPAMGEKELPDFFKKLDNYAGALQTRMAIKLLILTFVRPSELTGARWAEFDLEAAEWRYYVTKTKSNHIVPLSRQAVKLIRELHSMTGYSPFLFPSERAPLDKPMTRDTLSKVLRVLGYQGKATPHGFRAMATTMLNEMGFNSDWTDRQLAHREANKTKRAYDRAKYLTERRRMMQHWSDFLDGMARGGKVLIFKKGLP